MNEDIQKWVKRSNRKNAKLVRTEGQNHYIVYFDKGKARVGIVSNGMYCRYGIQCYGAMPNTDPFYCWQASPGLATRTTSRSWSTTSTASANYLTLISGLSKT